MAKEERQKRATRVNAHDWVGYVSDHRVCVTAYGNVSMTGAFVETTTPDSIGTRAELELFLGAESMSIPVEVARINLFSCERQRGLGMGLRFESLSAEAENFLKIYIEYAKEQRDESMTLKPSVAQVLEESMNTSTILTLLPRLSYDEEGEESTRDDATLESRPIPKREHDDSRNLEFMTIPPSVRDSSRGLGVASLSTGS